MGGQYEAPGYPPEPAYPPQQEYMGKHMAADEYLSDLKKDSRAKNLSPPPNARKHTQHTSTDEQARGGVSRLSYTDMDIETKMEISISI